MRTYTQENDNKILYAVCNGCGKKLLVENGFLREECFHAEHSFGYFSKKDGQNHSFDLCEACYDKWVKGFSIPVECREETELL